jgi:hypothetical protein
MIGRAQPNTAVVAEGRRGKDDRKQNTLAPLVLRTRIRIHMFLGLPYPDPSVRDTDPAPDPSVIK